MPDKYADDLFKRPRKKLDISPSGEKKKSEAKPSPEFQRTGNEKARSILDILEEAIRRVEQEKKLNKNLL